MFDVLGTLITGVLSGGATGLLGVLIQRFFDFKHKQQEIEIVKLQLANSIELAKMETERTLKAAEIDMEGKLAVSDGEVMQASFRHDAASYLNPAAQTKRGFVGSILAMAMGAVDFLRGILRPGMTAYLCWLVTVMFFWVRELAASHGLSLTPDQVMQLMVQVIATILYVFTTTALWWFGARPPKNKGDR